MTYKNIIFDFGGVIINLNQQLTLEKFGKLGLGTFFDNDNNRHFTDMLAKLEKGIIKAQEFRNAIRAFSANPVTDNDIDEAWNSMLLDIPPDRIKLLNLLKTRYRTFLLSNTNEIHYDYYTAQLKQVYGYHSLDSLFEAAYFSFRLQMSKPDVKIYEYVIDKHSLCAAETLFIDDSIINTEGAKKAGLLTHHLSGKETIHDIFSL